jgi:hypothetical protein
MHAYRQWLSRGGSMIATIALKVRVAHGSEVPADASGNAGHMAKGEVGHEAVGARAPS